MGEIPKSQGGAAQVFQSAVDGFGGSVGGAGPVEVGQHILGAFFNVRPSVMTSVSAAGTAS